MDKKLGKQAEAALDTITPGDPEFLESGLERLSDGIHRESLLTRGKSYQLSVACAGSGQARLSVQIKGQPTVKNLECDGTAAHTRIQDAPTEITIDVDAVSKASGMVAWRIAKTAE